MARENKTDRIVSSLASLTDSEWRSLVVRMAWHYRHPSPPPMDAMVRRLFGFPPKSTVWDIVRKRVNAVRKEAMDAERQSAKNPGRRVRVRTEYMRELMRKRRARAKAEGTIHPGQ